MTIPLPEPLRAKLAALPHSEWTLSMEIRAYGEAVRAEERERCAKVCEAEAIYRRSREDAPWPGDDDPRIQGHKSITADRLAAAIRSAAPPQCTAPPSEPK